MPDVEQVLGKAPPAAPRQKRDNAPSADAGGGGEPSGIDGGDLANAVEGAGCLLNLVIGAIRFVFAFVAGFFKLVFKLLAALGD
ncbi:MAG: hypothetical protein RLY93_03060 [Sumerlaeia bacterium]